MKALLEAYTKAFDTFDYTSIAKLYTLPCATCDGDGANVYEDRESLEQKFKQNCQAMKNMGYQSADYSILKQTQLAGAGVSLFVAWKVHTSNGPVEFRALYICHQVDQQWRIFTAQVYQGSFE